jgi:hypothetical protein
LKEIRTFGVKMAEASTKVVGGDEYRGGKYLGDIHVRAATEPWREMRMKRIRKQAFFGLLAVAATLPLWAQAGGVPAQRSRVVAQASEAKLAQRFRVWDSRAMITVRHSGKGMSWINDDEIMFVGIRIVSDPTVAHTGERVEYKLDIWNIRNGAIRTLREFGRQSIRPCFSDGHVLVWTRTKDGTHQSYYGDTNSISLAAPGKQFDGLFCRPVEQVPTLPVWTQGREIRWLERIDGGFLDFGEQRGAMENTAVRFYRHGASQHEGIQLPVGRREIATAIPYFAFKDAYFVASTYWQHPRPQGVPYPVYWLYADGRLERIVEIPWGPWRSRASSWTIPTNVGVLMVSHNFNVRNSRDLADAGLYLISGTSATRVLKAWIESVAVSPNGCKLAFDFADHVTQKVNTLRAIDLCKEVLQ